MLRTPSTAGNPRHAVEPRDGDDLARAHEPARRRLGASRELGSAGVRDGALMARVLFVCLHNAGRSQMSAAFFEQAAGGRHEARSAGTTPAERVHPEVVQAMREAGVDLSSRTPQQLTDDLAAWADIIVTMGCGDQCPYVPGKRYIDWDLTDPKAKPLAEVRRIRDEIRRLVQDLVEGLG